MAGEWIKMRSDLMTHPKVVRMSSALKADRLRIIGGLHATWCLFDVHSTDGVMEGYTPEVLDEHLGWPGFSVAMIAIEWLCWDGESLAAPRFEEHNGQSAKRRAMDAERKRKTRLEEEMSAAEADKKRTKSGPEKRRGEKSKDGEGADAPRLPPCPAQEIINIYHAALPTLPAVRLLGEKRRKVLSDLWKFVLTTSRSDGEPRAKNADEALAWIKAYFERARDNDFLMGRGPRSGDHAGWECDIDFLASERGLKQVIEKTRDAK